MTACGLLHPDRFMVNRNRMSFWWSLTIGLLWMMVSFTPESALAEGELKAVRIIEEREYLARVAMEFSGEIVPTYNTFDNRAVIYLRDCIWPQGPTRINGGDIIVRQVEWAEHPGGDTAAVHVVIRLADNHKTLFDLQQTDGKIVFSLLRPDKRILPKAEINGHYPLFSGRFYKVPEDIRQKMSKHTWKDDCPVPMDDLTYLTVSYWDYDGVSHQGELVVHDRVAEEVMDIFHDLYEAEFPIHSMTLIEEYQGDDNASMADDNTSAFNCRRIGNSDRFSRHSYGLAIDINPLRNPYVTDAGVLPAAGKDFADRSQERKGMIKKGGPCYNAFKKRGWRWGGEWKEAKDYQHFEKKD